MKKYRSHFWPRNSDWSPLEVARRRNLLIFNYFGIITIFIETIIRADEYIANPIDYLPALLIFGFCIYNIVYVPRLKSIKLLSKLYLAFVYLAVSSFVIREGMAASATLVLIFANLGASLLLGPLFAMLGVSITAGVFTYAYYNFHAPGIVTPFQIDHTFAQIGIITVIGIWICSSTSIHEMLRATKELEKERVRAEAANRAKSQFLANMSHEIRTPLNGIIGLSEILQNTKLDQEQRKFISTIFASGESLLSIINDILDFSKIEAGKFELEKTPFDIVDVIDDISALLEVTAHKKGVNFIVRTQTDIPAKLIGDVGRLRQILINIVGNAIKFTDEGQVVLQITCEKIENNHAHYRISVTDTGIGINEESLESIFNKFYQADGSSTRKIGGTGLGLAISQSLAQAMNGSMEVQSEVGMGSQFTLNLTLEIDQDINATGCEAKISPDENISTDLSENQPDTPQKQNTILIAEDNHINQMVIKNMIDYRKNNIIFADTGKYALEKYKTEKFDLVFMDISMPVMDGIEATQEIRSFEQHNKFKPTPIIALTAHAMTGDKEKFIKAGMNDYMSKPVSADKITKMIEHWCL